MDFENLIDNIFNETYNLFIETIKKNDVFMKSKPTLHEQYFLLAEAYQKMDNEGKDILDTIVKQLAEIHQSAQQFPQIKMIKNIPYKFL